MRLLWAHWEFRMAMQCCAPFCQETLFNEFRPPLKKFRPIVSQLSLMCFGFEPLTESRPSPYKEIPSASLIEDAYSFHFLETLLLGGGGRGWGAPILERECNIKAYLEQATHLEVRLRSIFHCLWRHAARTAYRTLKP